MVQYPIAIKTATKPKPFFATKLSKITYHVNQI